MIGYLGPRLHERLLAHLDELATATLHPAPSACPRCGGTELLASRDSHDLDLGVAYVRIRLVICRACGDVRMQCVDPSRLMSGTIGRTAVPTFLAVTLPARDGGPFR
jgi:hypothetical protein